MKGYKRISYEERVKIGFMLEQGKKQSEIARHLNRPKSTIKRDIERSKGSLYRPEVAQLLSEINNKQKHRGCKIINEPLLEQMIISLLKKRWSPSQISKKLKLQYPTDKRFHVSHESIYTYIYIWAKKELRKELISYLRQKKSVRRKPTDKGKLRSNIPDRVDISERPPEVDNRLIAGHWESDLIIGKDNKSALGTIVERTTRTTLIVKLSDKSSPTVCKAFADKLLTLPSQMRLSTTHDNGSEMAQHKLFTRETQIKVYFASPHSPWQRGTNENTNMLIRDFFPKGTDFRNVSEQKVQEVQDLLNERPRKTLGWRSPKEVFEEIILKNC